MGFSIDEPNADIDHAGQTMFKMDLVRWIFDRLDLNELERNIFEWRFFQNEPFLDWAEPSNAKGLYEAYNIVARAMYEVLESQGLAKTKLKDKRYNIKRVGAVVQSFRDNHLQAFREEIKTLKSILEQEY